MNKKGFTLVELAVIIAVMGIIAMFAVPKYQQMLDEARTAQAKYQLGVIRSTLSIYYAKYGKFPLTIGSSLFADGRVPEVEATNLNGEVVISNRVEVVYDDGIISAGVDRDPEMVVGEVTDEGGWVYDVLGDGSRADVRINAAGISAEGIRWFEY